MSSKLYLRIGEVAQELEIESHVIRYWEKEFHTFGLATVMSMRLAFCCMVVQKA